MRAGLKRRGEILHACGGSVSPAAGASEQTALASAIAALELALHRGDPRRVLQASLDALARSPNSEESVVASVTALTAYAQLGDFEQARSSLLGARAAYAMHLNLTGEQQAKFLEHGLLMDDLREANPDDLESQLQRLETSLSQHESQLAATDSEYRGLDSRRREARKKLEEGRDRRAEVGGLLERFELLDRHYVSDVARLRGIEEGGTLFEVLGQATCPLCGCSRATSTCGWRRSGAPSTRSPRDRTRPTRSGRLRPSGKRRSQPPPSRR